MCVCGSARSQKYVVRSSEKQKKQLLGDEKLEEAESDGGELLEEKLAQRSQAMEIHKVLHRLSEPYKEVFPCGPSESLSLVRSECFSEKVKTGRG